MNSYAKALLNEENKTVTTNGDRAYRSTLSKVLDFFSKAGSIRTVSESEKISLFNAAFMEDNLLALKALFYLRDIRGGVGERETFRVILKEQARRFPNTVIKNLELISEFGRWDDLFVLIGTNLEKNVLDLIKTQLLKDMATSEDQSISLLGKWLPSENTSSKETVLLAKKIIKNLGVTPRKYRKMLVKLRARLNIVETPMSKNLWKVIKYENVPSRASMIYRKAFKKKDETRYTEYLSKVEKGEAKINVSGIFPYELMYKARASSNEEKTLDLQWNALPLLLPEGVKAMAMADTSGSMECPISKETKAQAIDVSISMAIYLAEKNSGPFKDLMITFSSVPKLHRVSGKTLKDKYYNIPKIVQNTDLMAAFDLMLKVAVENKVPKEDMIDLLFIFSDMQFDDSRCIYKYNKSTYESAKTKFAVYGYGLPRVVFWNLNGSFASQPAKMDDRGVVMVSGFSHALFGNVLKGSDPFTNMIETLNGPRYSKISI